MRVLLAFTVNSTLQALLSLAVLTSCANLVFVYLEHVPVPVLQSYILEIVALAATIPLTYLTHMRTRTSSSVLLLFWPSYTVAFAIWARTLTATASPSQVLILLALKSAVTTLGIASFALECLAPEQVQASKHENPIITANIFSRWTFGWMTPLMKKGALEYITEHDLPNLPSQDESAKLIHDLKQAIRD